MWLNEDINIVYNMKKNVVYSNLFGEFEEERNEYTKKIVKRIYRYWLNKKIDLADKKIYLLNYLKVLKPCLKKELVMKYFKEDFEKVEIEKEEPVEEPKIVDSKIKKDLEQVVQKLIDFFSEFSFEPNFRFINTLAFASQKSYNQAKSYVSNYFELTDNGYKNEIVQKMSSLEFKEIIENLAKTNPSKRINTRFDLYYGSQGTGKTTKAIYESKANVMVCHSAMLPSDLMEDFKFIDGKANFTPSALQIAMTEGKKIVLDEINLLPFESLRFLQSLLDEKKNFNYKGVDITIKKGFKIIGTMNLIVNGSTFALPEPLVDRGGTLEKFILTAKELIGALL